MTSSASLSELRAQRAFECRLEPARALRSLDDAAAFLEDRGILTRTADCALPSLFEACHQPSFRPGRAGFAEWPETAYPWFSELADRDGVVQLSVHRGKRVLLTAATAALADPICRAELAAAGAGDSDPARLLRHLAGAGPSTLGDLKVELEWDAARLRRARAPLERTGALVSRGLIQPAERGGHLHSSMLARWDQVVTAASGPGSVDDLIAVCVRAAVLVPEREPRRWFSWSVQPDAALLQRLVDDGRLLRPAPGWLAVAG